MSPELWSRVAPLFEEARARRGAERDRVLDAAGDPAVRAEVERLLALDGEATRYFDRLHDDLRPEGAPLPDRVGPWRVVGVLGEGGMGRVLLGERDDGAFAQRVAIKVVESAAPGLVGRFRRERRILAALAHPHVARLLDGGALPDGRPYLVMEHVDGEPVTAYAEARGLGVEARLGLFLQVCGAVAYAHRALVVHRDLKPSNVLVAEGPDGRPHATLLDFGIARLLDADDDALTGPGHRPCTPAYAAPEQVGGGPVTTAADVYALGAVLYELLTGSRPPAAGDGGAPPPLPSADAPPARRRRLRGDLDRVVRTAMAPDPARRYGSAEALGRDVRRHLDGLPIEARRPTAGYRLHRFVRRHRRGVAAAAGLAVLLAALGALYARDVTAARARAEAEAARAERVVELLAGVLAGADDASVATAPLLAALEPAVARAEADLAEDPAARAAVLHTVGDLYRRVGRPDRADSLLRRALAARRALHDGHADGHHADDAATRYALGQSAMARGDAEAAAGWFRSAAEALEAAHGGDHPDLAWALLRWAEAEPRGTPGKAARYDRAVAMLRRIHGPRSPEVAEAVHEYHARGRADGTHEDYGAAFEEVVDIYRAHGVERDPRAVAALYNLGLHYERGGEVARAFPLFREAIRAGRATLPPESPLLTRMVTNYGASLHEQGRLAEADAVLRGAVEAARARLPDGSSATGNGLYWHGRNLAALDSLAAAEAALRASLATYAARGADGPPRHRVRVLLGTVLTRRGRFAEAERLLRESADAPDAASAGPALSALASLYEAWGRPARARGARDRLAGLGG